MTGATLTKQTSSAEWMFDEERPEMKQFFKLKQVVLDEDAKEGEQQVVTVEADDLKAIPIARLKKGSVEMWSIDVKCSMYPIKLTLVKGSGPVHVLGTHILEVDKSLLAAESDSECLDDEMGLEGEEEAEDEEEIESKVQSSAKKRKLDDMDQIKSEGGKKKKKAAEPAAKGKKGKSPVKSPPAKRKK